MNRIKQWKWIRTWKWTWKLGVVLSSILLVLVTSLVAYYIFVPKLQELEKLRNELERSKKEQNKLVMVGVPKLISEEDKKTLATQVPVSLEQSRFLKSLREEEKASGAVITNIQFTAAESAESADSKQTTTKKKSVLTPEQGRLTIEGNYDQVRSFIEKFSNMSRLVTFNAWRMSASDSVVVTDAPATSGSTQGPILVQQPGTNTNTTTTVVEEPGPKVTDADLNNDYLKDRSPIYEEKQMLRVLDLIQSQDYPTQAAKDMANLEMQHTFNRYMAGLLSREQASSILDQEYANRFIDGANTNIRQVLGLPPLKKQVVVNNSQTTPAPVFLLTRPSQTVQGSKVVSTRVRVEINFTIYYTPEARFFPPPEPLELYEPELRSNPVESY